MDTCTNTHQRNIKSDLVIEHDAALDPPPPARFPAACVARDGVGTDCCVFSRASALASSLGRFAVLCFALDCLCLLDALRSPASASIPFASASIPFVAPPTHSIAYCPTSCTSAASVPPRAEGAAYSSRACVLASADGPRHKRCTFSEMSSLVCFDRFGHFCWVDWRVERK